MNKLYSVGVALVGLSLISQPGGAEVLCRNKKGVLAARSGCKGKETQVDPAALGLVGPKGDKGDTGLVGPKGDQGEMGAAGLGARWALVKSDGTIAIQSGGISVTTEPGVARYYVNFGSSQANKAILVSAVCPADTCSLVRGAVIAAFCGGGAAGVTCPPSINDDSHISVTTMSPGGFPTLPSDFFVAVL